MSSTSETPRVDTARFHAMFDALSQYGATARGGLHRLTGSPEDGQVRDRFCAMLRLAGMEVRVDPVGNIFGLCEWTPGADFLLVGSHLDSQPNGGRFDGAYGVVAGAAVCMSLKEAVDAGESAPPLNLAVVNWTNEEGARFRPSLTGSSVFTGKLALADALALVDDAGISLGEALEAIGYRGRDQGPTPAGCVELHNEIGRVLEDADADIGVVTRNWGANKYELVFHGEQAHTGPTPMAERKDALVAASMMIVEARRLADGYADDQLRTSVGRAVIEPNSANVVPSRVTLSLEIRSPDRAILDSLDDAVREIWAQIQRDTQCAVEVAAESRREALPFWPAGADRAEAIATDLGYTTRRLDTVAGHDVVAMMAMVPGVLLNVPSYHGIGHNEDEYTSPEQLTRGVEVLNALVWDLLHNDPRGARE
ncbi:Zn-dependent hydrolase [Aquisalimonas asiatica]|uniref:N-carbamoyl-L-amino-acid hydrolase n=1 Tax=Aquisalimonas asiatica TaxID=406100 RepID=A0A1H8PYT8_9GAMM|nr:Zn-dependent hydrolase [Aquisalimonas asiatica]SEO47182.1 N-carbamoyl-L-amino-acid hydrolase [Aquisalimonas asiatica]